MKILIGYIILINAITFITFASDKSAAKGGRRRVPEKTLLGMSFFGGALGGYLSMQLFHQKTRKPRFSVGVPVMLLLQAAILIYIWMRIKV